MAVNVTEKDKTLNEIIDGCHRCDRLVAVRAVAKRPCHLSQPSLWFPTEPPAEQEKNLWRNMGTYDAQDEWPDKARDLPETAWKTAAE